MRRFKFSPRVTIICGILAALMVRASFWQWSRHQQKIEYIAELNRRLEAPIVSIETVRNDPTINWNLLVHRRLTISCHYDFAHEMILRNRRLNERPGAFVLTPCRFAENQPAIIVNRGFVSYAFMEPEKRKQFQKAAEVSFTGLIKESMTRKIFSPQDPPAGGTNPWVDAWLRVDIESIQKQLPYPLLPVYAEIMSDTAASAATERIIDTKSGREEMFLPGQQINIAGPELTPAADYPIPVFDTVASPGRHLGYVYEWAFMALITVLIGIVLQLRRA